MPRVDDLGVPRGRIQKAFQALLSISSITPVPEGGNCRVFGQHSRLLGGLSCLSWDQDYHSTKRSLASES